jgi:hypothetical protein
MFITYRRERWSRRESCRWGTVTMPLSYLSVFSRKPPKVEIPDDVRQLQYALAICLADLAVADDQWIYKTSLDMAKKMHDLGGRMLPWPLS